MSNQILQTTSLTNVAILGSGIAGSTAARYLAETGLFHVTVFEAGYGIGGRTSTRTTRDEYKLAFDHGAQYISAPAKTNLFQKELEKWEDCGFVKEWNGRFGDVYLDHGTKCADNNGKQQQQQQRAAIIKQEDTTTTKTTNKGEVNKKRQRRMVGYPRMNSICQNLLQHKNIKMVLQTRACATFHHHHQKEEEEEENEETSLSSSRGDKNNNKDCWTLVAHKSKKDDNDKQEEILGTFDWLICSDRLSATNNRADLRNAPLPTFKTAVSFIENVPSLVLMVAFESPVTGLELDGIQFINSSSSNNNDDDGGGGDDNDWGCLAWAARDTSKPGRERVDKKECWVVQSVPGVAKDLIASVTAKGGTFEEAREMVREKAKEMVLNDFLNAIKTLQRQQEEWDDNDGEKKEEEEENDIPKIVSAVGHRWSAAFPSVPPTPFWDKASGEGGGSEDFFADTKQKFVACGDYMSQYTGRIEGAFLSGNAAADFVLDTITRGEGKK